MKLVEALRSVAPGRIAQIARNVLVERLDSWTNEVTGAGTPRDKTSYTAFCGVDYLSDQQLSNIYHGDDLAQRMVDIVPDEMLREGFSVDLGDAGQDTELSDQLEALGAREKLANAIRWGRLFGAGALLIGADDGRPASKELIPERANGVSYLYELDKRLLYPLTWYTDAGDPKLGRPRTYLVGSASPYTMLGQYQEVHESRLLMFGGSTTGIWERIANFGYDRSVLQRAFEALRAFNTGWKSVEILLADGNQAVFKMQGLAELIGANGESALQARLQTMDLYRSVMRALVVDAGDPETKGGAESFERQQVTLTDYPATLDRFMLRLAAAVQIPATILYGQSPAGENATGDADYRWFYSRIRSQQNLILTPRVRKLVRVMTRTKALRAQKDPSAIKITFPNLWSESPKDEGARRLALATGDAAYVNAGILTPEEVALSRFGGPTFGEEITLTKEGREVREKMLEENLEDELNPPDPVPPAPANGGANAAAAAVKASIQPPKAAPTAATGGEQRTDAGEDLVDVVGKAERAIIAGGPRTGKSTTSARAGERYRRDIRSTDALSDSHGWIEASAEIARWIDDPKYIIEGVAAPRALRKWMRANPDKKLDATVVYFGRAVSPQTDQQRRMSKDVAKVWNEIRGELIARGCTVIERDS